MTLLEQIQHQLRALPPEKQSEVLDFVNFLGQKASTAKRKKKKSLSQHPAFGSWQGRNIDSLEFEQKLRSEWDSH